MATNEIQAKQGTSVPVTLTNLGSLPTSLTRTAGWTSAGINHGSVLALDYLLSGQFTVASAGLTAGQIDMRVYGTVDATPTWQDLFSTGTEGSVGLATIHDEEQREAGLHLHASSATDTDASNVYPMAPRGIARLFGNLGLPHQWAIFVAHNTGANLHASAHRIDYTPVLAQYTP